MALQGSQRTSRLSQMQMRFQQKQQIEKEQKKIDLLGTTTRVVKVSAANETEEAKLLTSSLGGGKVRQMFEERRTGIDKSYPLKPISGNAKITINGNDTNGIKAPPKSKSLNGIVTRQKPLAITDNETHHQILDKDSLNNTIIATRYNSTNRVPSLKSNTNNHVANNNNHVNNNNIMKQQLKPVSTNNSSAPKISATTPISSNTSDRKSIIEIKKTSSPSTSAKSTRQQEIKTSSRPSPTTRASVTKTIATSTREKEAAKKAFAPPPAGMIQCGVCGRNFLEDRIAKHETICSKAANKKRKIFDSTKHRVQGTEAEVYVKKALKTKTKAPEKPVVKKGDWRKKHEEFIQAIRAAKEVQAHLKAGKDIRDLPPPPPSDYSDYVQCPHCSRRFNQGAAERHIPKCANMLHNKPKPSKSMAKGRR